MDKIRIDKWLWTIRIFKSRTMATDASKIGRVRLNGQTAKPSTLVKKDDKITVTKNGFNFEFEVVQVLKSRVSAPLAAEAYIDHTSPEELNKYKSWFIGKSRNEFRDKGTGRPTKKERREIQDYKEDLFIPYDWDEEE